MTISDGGTKLRARFELACTKEFSRRYHRKFPDRTSGGVIEIEDYKLVIPIVIDANALANLNQDL